MEDCLLDEIIISLYHIGLAVRAHVSNEISVYNLEEPNEFDGRLEPELKHLGYVHIQGMDAVTLIGPDYCGERTFLPISDRDFHKKLFMFFGVDESRVERFFDRKFGDPMVISVPKGVRLKP